MTKIYYEKSCYFSVDLKWSEVKWSEAEVEVEVAELARGETRLPPNSFETWKERIPTFILNYQFFELGEEAIIFFS